MRAQCMLPVLAVAAAIALSACTSNPVGPQPSAAPTASAPPSPTVIPTPTTAPPTQDPAAADPVDVRCGRLVPAAVATLLSPGLRRERGWTPLDDSPAARLEALAGTACAWRDAAGNLLEVAVAQPSADDAIALKNDLVDRSNSVPTYGQEAYFQVVDHIGQVDAFRGRTWISARSNRFFEPGDAADVVAAVDRALGLTPTPVTTPTGSPTSTIAPPPTSTTN